MIEQISRQLEKLDVPKGASILIAVSGGCDSMALAFILSRLQKQNRYRLALAHLNHNMRPAAETNKDLKVIQNLANRLHLTLKTDRLEPETLVSFNNGFEDAARQARKIFLAQTAKNIKAQFIALAHTQNDQEETVYMRMLQNAGLSGLKGIPSRNCNIIRPLLHCSKEQLQDLLLAHNIAWHEDSTNRLPIYLRNRARLQLQAIRQINPGFNQGLLQLSRRACEAETALELYFQTLLNHETQFSDSISYPLEIFKGIGFFMQKKLLYRWFNLTMKGIAPPDFRLPERFLKSMRLAKQGPIILRGYGILLKRIKKNLIFSQEALKP